jgi:hypothetical protein
MVVAEDLLSALSGADEDTKLGSVLVHLEASYAQRLGFDRAPLHLSRCCVAYVEISCIHYSLQT